MKIIDEKEAKHENTVMPLYQDEAVAEKYINNRFNWSWSRLLHNRQVEVINLSIERYGIKSALEVAPGPARLTTEIKGIRKGLMVEASEEMIQVAQKRLEGKNLLDIWEIKHGNAFDLSEIPDKFDLVYSFRFIRHFEIDERERLYQQMASRLKKNGIFVFDVVNRLIRLKIDNRKSQNSNLEKLSVYDATYIDSEIQVEMERNGFKILLLVPVIKHFSIQSWLSYKLDPRLPRLSNLAVSLLEKTTSKNPLEWIAVCKKTD